MEEQDRTRTSRNDAGRDVLIDNRRPGRRHITNKHLIALLRRPIPSDIPALDADDTPIVTPIEKPKRPDLDPALGILVALALGIILWMVIAAAVWAALRLF